MSIQWTSQSHEWREGKNPKMGIRVRKGDLLSVVSHGNDEQRSGVPTCTRSTHGHMKERKPVGKKKVVRVERREGIWVSECNLNALYMNQVVKKMLTWNFQENKGVNNYTYNVYNKNFEFWKYMLVNAFKCKSWYQIQLFLHCLVKCVCFDICINQCIIFFMWWLVMSQKHPLIASGVTISNTKSTKYIHSCYFWSHTHKVDYLRSSRCSIKKKMSAVN